jgi:hypothetical protein
LRKFQFLVLTGVFVLIIIDTFIIPYLHHRTVSTQTNLLKSSIRQTPLWVDWLIAALLWHLFSLTLLMFYHHMPSYNTWCSYSDYGDSERFSIPKGRSRDYKDPHKYDRSPMSTASTCVATSSINLTAVFASLLLPYPSMPAKL